MSSRLVVFLTVFATLAACGSELDAQLELREEVQPDPIKACGIPAKGSIPGHESEFYLCAEPFADFGNGCGPDGYLLGYGTKYSQRFYNHTRPQMSARGQRWIDDVLVCLQRE